MRQSDLGAFVLPALLVGTKRKQIPFSEVFDVIIEPADPKAGLKALCLAGHSLRFARMEPPGDFVAPGSLPVDRTFLPDELRKKFIGLVAQTEGENVPLMREALAQAMERGKVAPHPFDMEDASAFVVAHAGRLGALAFEWAQAQKSDSIIGDYFDWSPLDDTCWTRSNIGQRERYLRLRRQEDPDAARALLEADWSNLDADARFRLLGCLWVGLCAEDEGFLAALGKDRAPRVRVTASAMLRRIVPAQASDDLKELQGRIKQGSGGIFQKRKTFALEYPANVKETGRLQWMLDSFGQLGLETIAHSLGCAASELIEGAAKDEGLLFVLLLAASNDKRFDCLADISRVLGDGWQRLSGTDFADLPEYSPGELQQWIDIVVRPHEWDADIEWPVARRLYSLCKGEPLSPARFDGWLRSRWARSSIEGQGSLPHRSLELMAILCPPSRRHSLEALIGTDDATQPVRWFMELLDFLEAPKHG